MASALGHFLCFACPSRGTFGFDLPVTIYLKEGQHHSLALLIWAQQLALRMNKLPTGSASQQMKSPGHKACAQWHKQVEACRMKWRRAGEQAREPQQRRMYSTKRQKAQLKNRFPWRNLPPSRPMTCTHILHVLPV